MCVHAHTRHHDGTVCKLHTQHVVVNLKTADLTGNEITGNIYLSLRGNTNYSHFVIHAKNASTAQ